MAIQHGATRPELRPMKFLGLERGLIKDLSDGREFLGLILHLDNEAGRPDDLVSIILTADDGDFLEGQLRAED